MRTTEGTPRGSTVRRLRKLFRVPARFADTEQSTWKEDYRPMPKSNISRAPWRRPRYVTNVGSARLPVVSDDSSTLQGSHAPDRDRSSITDSRGYLLRQRPGCDVPVGPKAAVHLSKGFTDREIAILVAVEQLGMVSAEQFARAFFNTHRSAYEMLLSMAQKRFLVNPGADPMIIRRAVGHRPPPRNPVYALDWNGAYLLAYKHNHPLSNWRPSTAALISTRLGHNLGVSEIWSYFMAAARATQEAIMPLDNRYTYELSLAFQNERAALLTRGNSSSIRSSVTPSTIDKVLLQPDGALILAVHRTTSPRSCVPSVSEGTQSEGTPITKGPPLVDSTSPRWSATLSSWRPSFLPCPPSSEVMLHNEKLAASDPGFTYYRSLLLEMETGINNITDTMTKIKSYNRVIRTNQEAWTSAYGHSPRVLVVVPSDSQLEGEALKWRLHYFYKQEFGSASYQFANPGQDAQRRGFARRRKKRESRQTRQPECPPGRNSACPVGASMLVRCHGRVLEAAR